MGFWLISAASVSGYVLLGIFILVALGRAIGNVIHRFAARLPRRSLLKRYLMFVTSVAFFCLLAMRGCYIAAVIVDTQFHSDPFRIDPSWQRSASLGDR